MSSSGLELEREIIDRAQSLFDVVGVTSGCEAFRFTPCLN